MPRPTVLLADDDISVCTVLSQAVRQAGFSVVTTDDPNVLLDWVSNGKGDLVITDILMPKGNGLDFLPKLKALRPNLPIMVISANNTLMTEVRAVEEGAFKYFPKPFDLEEIVACVQHSLAHHIREEDIPHELDVPQGNVLVGRSPAMQEVYKAIARLVHVDLSVMLHGESGTGKELIARTLHTLSPRRERAFVAINMAAIPHDLVESDLFGHEKGAFTGATTRKAGRFEQAQGGTLFLDEIGDMPLDVQTRLLRTLQENEYTPVGATKAHKADVRIISATHRHLETMVAAGEFRKDLYFQLNVVPITVPPLRDRQEDIEALAQHALNRAREKGLPQKQLSADGLKALQAHHWSGNVRELQNLIYRLAALESDPVLTGRMIRTALKPVKSDAKPHTNHTGTSLQEVVEAHLHQYFFVHKGQMPAPGLYQRLLEIIEKPLLRITMDAVDKNQLRAAEILGINRNTLRKKLKEHGIWKTL